MYFTCKSLSIWTVLRLNILTYINFYFSRKFSRVQRCATYAFSEQGFYLMLTLLFNYSTFSPPPNLHTCISLLENYRLPQCLAWRFSPLLTFFSLVSSPAFRDTSHSRFRRTDHNQCLPNFLEMLLLALSQIYTRAFHLWKSVALKNAWVKDSRPCISFFHSRGFARLAMWHTRDFGVGISNYAYWTSWRC